MEDPVDEAEEYAGGEGGGEQGTCALRMCSSKTAADGGAAAASFSPRSQLKMKVRQGAMSEEEDIRMGGTGESGDSDGSAEEGGRAEGAGSGCEGGEGGSTMSSLEVTRETTRATTRTTARSFER